ncbi:helix-turn-helix domain-containing protein [Mesorhizobium sp. AR10]|uniref:helix-turn-helix domain-containing protein n=1 Tax=Mesorhizobium sp. AR10 TaxID=2865839 RepID=UPI0039B6F966
MPGGGVSGAARALGTTQSSVSRHLSVLADYLDAQFWSGVGEAANSPNMVGLLVPLSESRLIQSASPLTE